MLQSETADIEEVAAAMGRTPGWIRRHCRRLNHESCFPLPLPGSNWRFPRRALELWLMAGGVLRREGAANLNHTPPPSLIELHRQELQKRYGGAS